LRQPDGEYAQGELFAEPEGEEVKTIHNTPHHYHLVDTPEKAKELAGKLKKQKTFCFDTETTGLDPNNAELVGISFSWKAYEAWYVPLSENYHHATQQLAVFKDVLEDEKIEKTGQNIKFDISILRWYDIVVKGKIFDTMIAHYLLEPDQRHNMDALAETYLHYKPVPIESLIGKKGKNQRSMRTVALDEIKEYAAEDADVTLQLREIFEPKLKETGTEKLFYETEMPLVPVLAAMEAEGVKLDTETLAKFGEKLTVEIAEMEKEIYEMAGTEFNIASPKQLGEVYLNG